MTVREGTPKYLIENRSTRLSMYYSELDEGAVTPDVKKKIKECKDSSQIGRIIGYRHNYFSSQKKIKLECLSTKSFSFGPRSPKYLTLGVGGLENNYSINEGDNQGDIDSNGVMTVDVEVTGQSTPLIVCVGEGEEVTYLHLIMEIYTDGVHNVISVADAMPLFRDLHSGELRDITIRNLRSMSIMNQHNLTRKLKRLKAA